MKFVTPVLMSFFVMSFCDLVGIGVDRVKIDFTLSNTLAQLIPSAVFLWFFVLVGSGRNPSGPHWQEEST